MEEFRRLGRKPESKDVDCGRRDHKEHLNANSSNQAPVTFEELLVSSLAQTDALAKLLIEKGIITQQVTYQGMFKPTPH
jgi:hypothetical protein